ncbi:glycosyltransferase family 39 protein [Metabacillus idriensis]|uniref:Glycosyltransferase family 39 protein n=1 Tax=Metabacillus idriensis TaxID=324768 RepID=A0A6I2MB20_9BACI|nr:glycosyltransferase family 39 protein [Metabacillus idriensis]MCM3596569.1 glycosyltransferase family 39 protein [Metabacillus idriensis]MRX55348.1 glycosyltransferase family 39 protein [Metabacillus idriensis]OHR68142.1 hypothetical protein HMPREF3291_09765 [Bacillus sp. HMSC76G11]
MNKIKKFIQSRNEFVIPILFAILLVPLSYFHNTFEEWDGVMQLFAGRAIFDGEGYAGWPSHYWPPLYSLLAGFLDLFMPGFLASKLISHAAGVLLLYVVYKLAMELTKDESTALLSQLFLVVNPLYLLSSLQAENHMLDSLFFVSSILLLFRSLKFPGSKEFIVLGVMAGLAGLTRYTSYILVPLIILTVLLAFNWKKAWKPLILFVVSFSVVSSPWWLHNSLLNGSPFATWQYINIGYGLFDRNPLWWWKWHADYNGISDIILSNPWAFIQHVFSNMLISLLLMVGTCAALSPFVLPAWISSPFRIKKIYSVSLLTGVVLFIFLVSQAFVFPQVFLSWTVVFTILSIHFIITYLVRYERRHSFLKVMLKSVISILFCCGLLTTGYLTHQYIKGDDYDGGQLADYKAITETLKAYDPDIGHKTVMAVNPAWAYYLGSQFIMMPLYYEGEVAGIYTYEALDEKVIQHAQNTYGSPFIPPVKSDYLIFDRFTVNYLPQFSFLFNPHSSQVPSTFHLVYQSKEVVVYELKEVIPSEK